MLFVIHCQNHPELTYRGGQQPIVHLEADLDAVLEWADRVGRRWAISLSNAGATYAQFRSSRNALHELNWAAIQATDFRTPDVKEGKQAEFLVHGSLPWELIGRIGVRSSAVEECVHEALAPTAHRPRVQVRPEWYY